MKILKEIEEKSLRYLLELFHYVKDDQSRKIDIYEIGNKLDWSEDETLHSTEELVRLGLVEYEKKLSNISITLKGVKVSRRFIWRQKRRESADYPWACSIG